MPVLNHQKLRQPVWKSIAPLIMGPTIKEIKYMAKYSVWYLPRSCKKIMSAITCGISVSQGPAPTPLSTLAPINEL